ncbi:MAG: hypothetical protein JSR12_03690 [Bacteroidetes bacterium]|nr:hypothetical protein [Bacteroidota bacterium]
MNKLFYFKVTFLQISAGLFTGMIVYGLFDIDFSKSEMIMSLIKKSLVTATSTGLILGVLNMFFKIGSFQKRQE